MSFIKRLSLSFFLVLAGVNVSKAAEPIKDPENTLVMELKTGKVVIAMRPDLAPKTVARIKQLVREDYYDGVVFHRVIEGFMAQGGDPTGTGRGGTGFKLPDEFSSAKHVRGTVSMANTGLPNSSDSQFFICFAPQSSLNGKYIVWGQVIEGMDHVDEIKKGDDARNGLVTDPDHIITMRVLADLNK